MSEYRLFDVGNGTIQLLVALILIAFAPVLAGWVAVLLERIAAGRKARGQAVVDRVRAELAEKGWAVLPKGFDARAVISGRQPAQRPAAWRAPCGELVRLPETKTDSGPTAA